MVIDKTTGRGCAWSIASKTIIKELIAEGIVGKVICRRTRRNGYELLTVDGYRNEKDVYVRSQRDIKLTDIPLWAPSFINSKIWEQAVRKFHTYESLDRNVTNYLLPEMEEYLRSIPDSDLISMTREFLIEHGVIYKPICQRTGNTYYFNKDEVYSVDKKSELFLQEGRQKFNIFKITFENCFNTNVWRKATSQFEVGMTLRECISIFLQTELAHSPPQELVPIDRLIQHIAPPIYERVPGNDNKATFDHIHMTVGLPRYRFNSWKDLKDEIKKYQREIYQRVIQKLKQDCQFKRYGVPINFLKLSDVILRRDFSMEFIFELRESESTSPLDMENKKNQGNT